MLIFYYQITDDHQQRRNLTVFFSLPFTDDVIVLNDKMPKFEAQKIFFLYICQIFKEKKMESKIYTWTFLIICFSFCTKKATYRISTGRKKRRLIESHLAVSCASNDCIYEISHKHPFSSSHSLASVLFCI